MCLHRLGGFFPLIFFPSGHIIHHLSRGQKTATEKSVKYSLGTCFMLGTVTAAEKPETVWRSMGLNETECSSHAIPG